MNKYPKIKTVFLRDPDTKYKTLLWGQYALPEFEYLKNNIWVFTEKIDGTNVRVMWDCEAGTLQFGGRTDDAQMPTFLYSKLQTMFPIKKFQSAYPDISMTIYGEGFGARIQKGGGNYIPDGVSVIAFDVLIGDTWLERDNVEDIAGVLCIDVVPIVGMGILNAGIDLVGDGLLSKFGSFPAEGLVMRPQVELLNRGGGRIITKIKHKDFS